ncbi:hypothetical protein ARMGADRAFT_291616 [Armillaria gallica]|uniref:Secreted protein n=1 Tax=Armillaria gallica TaxID=47427 RepID=A0A2H3DGZ8_ARMGA|nr:hypothetical protein ARMGADRAFT_291616 [Armillaria gallica]
MCSVVLGWFWILGKSSLFQIANAIRDVCFRKRELTVRRTLSSRVAAFYLIRYIGRARSSHGYLTLIPASTDVPSLHRLRGQTEGGFWRALSPRMVSNIMHHGARQR